MVWPDIIASLFIFLVLFIPDPAATVAQLFMGDYFHAWDVIFMGTVYGLFNGLTPNIDMNATYGLGLTLFIKQGMAVLGGFDYTHALIVLFWSGIIYFCGWYLLLRRMFHSRIMAFAAIILGMRLQMFVTIVVPIVWNEMQCSILRFFFDVVFFWALYLYEKRERPKYLWLMALSASLGIYHMPTTGVFLAAAMLVLVCLQSLRLWLSVQTSTFGKIARLWRPMLFIPVGVTIFYYLTVGTHLWSVQFWKNTADYAGYFAKGFFYTPMLDPLRRGEYLMVIGGLLIPVIYLASAFFYGWRYVTTSKEKGDIWIVTLAVYGLGLFTYYVGMSHKYWTVILPCVFIVFYWADQRLHHASKPWQFRIRWLVLALCLYTLLTSTMFRAYPNLLNISRDPVVDSRVRIKVGHDVPYFHQLSVDFPQWIKVPYNSLGEEDEKFKHEADFVDHDALKSYYRLETSFKEDAGLIDALTKPGQRVPVLSSFEVMILSKAERKPFFYYFPLLNSHPMRMRNFVVTTIFSYPQLQRCLDQLETVKPEYVFMEKVFLTEQVHPWYLQEYEDLINLVRYVKRYYVPYAEGKYLIAMKRKTDA